MSAVSAHDNSILWVTLRTGPATEEPHFCVTSSLTGPAHSQIGPYAQLSASSPHMTSAMDISSINISVHCPMNWPRPMPFINQNKDK